MLSKPTSFNGKLVLEAYQPKGLQEEKKSGWVTVSQKGRLESLKVLVDAKLTDGTTILAGSIVYIREEVLHSAPWAKNRFKNNLLTEEFILANIGDVEYINPISPPMGES
jgi:hypothetical protein